MDDNKKKKNKVGILTLFYKTYNYGAQLQAYALQKAIEKKGYTCEQIRFTWSNEQTRFNYENVSVNKAAFESFSSKIPHSRRIFTSQDLSDANNEYDIFVCGSDQIWGVKNSMPWYVLPQMALSFAEESKRKIAYGASYGSALITNDQAEILKGFLNRIDYISVREKSAVELTEKISGKSVANVVDPVMLLSAEEWNEVANEGAIKIENPYVLLYNVGAAKSLLRMAESFSREKGLNLVNISYTEGAGVGPCEFVKYVRDAEYIITDSFHGTVLSLIYKKQFITYGVDRIETPYSRNTRIKDMLEAYGLESRFSLEKNKRQFNILEDKIVWNSIEKKLLDNIASSNKFLENSLTMEQNHNNFSNSAAYLNKDVVRVGRCVGCEACFETCSSGCISISNDALGFRIPVFTLDKCVDCKKCTKVCPVYKKEDKSVTNSNVPIQIYALRAKDDTIVARSSSGGAFAVIAEKFLQESGIVCGAAYMEDKTVSHICISSTDNLFRLQGSKYVQSMENGCFKAIKEYLEYEKKVLFSGTPCQVEGLKGYLQKDYDNLYCIDLVCGGVTAPDLWKKYVDYYESKYRGKITDFDMRSKALGFYKSDGHLQFSMSHIINGKKFIIDKSKDLFLNTRFSFYRESCYACQFKGCNHSSDITIGDYVGLNRIALEEDDNKGINCVIVRTLRGRNLLEEIKGQVDAYPHTYEEVTRYNSMIEGNMPKPAGYDYLRKLAESEDIERISLENDKIRLHEDKEILYHTFVLELKRNELMLKLKKYVSLQCSPEYDPNVKGEILIYGAGKLGRELASCIGRGMVAFIDKSSRLTNVMGFPTYRPNDVRLKELFKYKEITVIVTPVWDYIEIREDLQNILPDAKILSLEEVVASI